MEFIAIKDSQIIGSAETEIQAQDSIDRDRVENQGKSVDSAYDILHVVKRSSSND